MNDATFGQVLTDPAISTALGIQRDVIRAFRQRARAVLGDACPVADGVDDSLRRNVFSALFLATQMHLGVPREQWPFCGLVSQCMRAWVTGCDNLLDDEFKEVLHFDLGPGGHRFASVLGIMTADRILTDLLAAEMAAGRLDLRQAAELSHLSLRALIPSGRQEHEEELGAHLVLPPEDLLQTIHVAKTGLLFEAPIAVAEAVVGRGGGAFAHARAGLRAFGLACQILDDIVDIADDVPACRHNYLVSLAVVGDGGKAVTYPEIVTTDAAVCRRASHRAGQLFDDARRELFALGWQPDPAAWAALVRCIPMLLDVPDDLHDLLQDAACSSG